MESESLDEQVLKQNEVSTQEHIEPQKSQGIIQKTLSIFGLGKERDLSTQTNPATPIENATQHSPMQPLNREVIQSEDTAKLEETRRKLQEETKVPTWVQRKNEGLLEGKITSKPLS